MAHLTYQRTVVGYHGCDAAVAERVLAGKAELKISTNPYDWLGEMEGIAYQTVRGVFLEGGPAFPGSEIALKSHIQVAVRDSKCIVQFFRPDSADYRSDRYYSPR